MNLTNRLKKLGIPVTAGKVKKSDIKKVLANGAIDSLAKRIALYIFNEGLEADHVLSRIDAYARQHLKKLSPTKMAASTDVEVKNPGILEVPEGKKVMDLPLSHFKSLMDKKGKAPIMRALVNLERWNKKQNPSVSKWASKTIDNLKEKD